MTGYVPGQNPDTNGGGQDLVLEWVSDLLFLTQLASNETVQLYYRKTPLAENEPVIANCVWYSLMLCSRPRQHTIQPLAQHPSQSSTRTARQLVSALQIADDARRLRVAT